MKSLTFVKVGFEMTNNTHVDWVTNDPSHTGYKPYGRKSDVQRRCLPDFADYD